MSKHINDDKGYSFKYSIHSVKAANLHPLTIHCTQKVYSATHTRTVVSST